MHQVTQIENGLRVATAFMPHMASVSLGLWVGTGGRYEPAPLNGVSHFIEHMLFKGTRRRSAEEISQAVEGVGGHLNAFTDEEFTCFFARAAHERFATLLEVLTDMFLHSVFDPADIAKERNVIKEEMAMYLDQPYTHVQELLNQLMWPDHPLGRPLTGTARTIDRLGRDQMLGYRRDHYVTGNTALVVAGPLPHKQVVKAVGRMANRFPRGKAPSFTPVTSSQGAPAVRLFTKKVEQTQLALGIRACSRHDDQRFALRLLNVILGENTSSRLFQVVREDHGLAYSIHSGTTHFDDTGALVISAGLETRALQKSLRLVLRELKRLADQAPSPKELRRARDYIIGQLELTLESTENHMTWLGEQLLAYGRVKTPAEIKRRVSQVQPSDIRAAARETFRPGRMNLALVSPLKRPAGLTALLSR